MSDKPNPLRPVVFTYPEETTTQGTTYLAGSTFQTATPENVWRVHPDAHIVRYVDGGEYKERAAKDAVRLRDNPPETRSRSAAAKEDTKTETKAG